MPTAGTVVKTSSTTGTSPAATLVYTTPGAVNVLCISANSTGTGVQPQIQTPAGWTLACPVAWKSGSPSHEIAVVYRKYQTGDPTTQAASIAAAGGGNIAVAPVGFAAGELDGTTIIVSGEAAAANAAGPTTDVTAALTLGGARYVISVFGNRSGATFSTASDGNVHDPIQAQDHQSSAASIAVCFATTPTSSGAARSLLSSVSTSINNTAIIAFNPATSYTGAANYGPGAGLSATGTASQPGVVSVAAGVGLAAAGSPAAVGSVALSPGVTLASLTPIVAQLKSGLTQWIAHRNGYASSYGECTLAGYRAAAAQYSKAILEVPVWASSDGIYYCIHDRMTGSRGQYTGPNGSVDVTATSSAVLDQYVSVVGGNPLARLTDVLDALRGRMFAVENKQGISQGTLSTLLDAHAGVGYWIFKGPYNDTTNALVAAGHGAPMWLYFYNTQTGSLSSTLSTVSGAGVPVLYGWGDFSAAPVPVQSDSDTFWSFVTAHGLQAWAFILGTSGQKATADSQATADGAAFSGYMTSGFAALAPTDGGQVALQPGAALSAAGGPGWAVGVPLPAGVALAAAGVPSVAAAVALPVGAGLAAAGAATAGGSVGLELGAALSVAASPAAASATAAFDAGVVLAADGVAGWVLDVPLPVGVALDTAGAFGLLASATFVAGVELDASGRAVVVVVDAFDGSLLGWLAGPDRWGVRAGPAAWQVVLGAARWLLRSLGDVVKVADRRLVNLQVRSPRPLTDPDVSVESCVSQSRSVPDGAVWAPIVIPADYAWPGAAGWATVAAWVGPGLPVGTNYVLTHVTAGGEDFYDVAASVQVEE